MNPAQFWGNITTQVKAKEEAGFVTTSADIWGRIEGYTFFNASHGGVDLTWSSLAKSRAFQDGDMPLPLVVADGQYFNKFEDSPTPKEPIYEFSPWEFGTYDNSIYGFAPLQYLGSRFVNGVVPANETCVRGYDNAGLIMGTSSDVYDLDGVDIAAQLRKLIPEISSQNAALGDVLSNAVEEYLGALSSTNSTVNGPAAYDPSPFYQYNKDSSPFAQGTRLTVVDGGEDGQNIPLNPLIQRKRNVDIIFAVDSGSDVAANWPNGTTMIATYERTLAGFANDTSFPSIPDANTFVNLGLNSHPTFFGCNSSNLTAPAPLIVYLPNHPVTYMSNLALNESSFNTTRRDSIILNGYNIATQANGTLDSDWSTCVGCAILSRSFDRTDTTVPKACSQCFQRYCWNGTIDDRTPSSPYAPSVTLSSWTPGSTSTSTSAAAHGMSTSLVPAGWSAVAIVAMVLSKLI
ncbi:lysophospholipase 1 [Aspergillus pseudoviridinutans]|uniref:Lysophospholipase n=1 Tax=Aspergillus pseudoviridinutans TaxID=1517512 RepID=A0A9P3ER56_9EURO|nr:lysophospholipase 1 [Aspergillus pseudoviridinutans]GIJ84639.1 lysophospholipase 1 [Aspergillus pseudoviridinutans]